MNEVLEKIQKKGPISPALLAYSLGRDVQEIEGEVEALQLQGIPVISNEKGDYYIATSKEEIAAYVARSIVPLIQHATNRMMALMHALGE